MCSNVLCPAQYVSGLHTLMRNLFHTLSDLTFSCSMETSFLLLVLNLTPAALKMDFDVKKKSGDVQNSLLKAGSWFLVLALRVTSCSAVRRSRGLHLFHPLSWHATLPVNMNIVLIGLFMKTGWVRCIESKVRIKSFTWLQQRTVTWLFKQHSLSCCGV